MKAILLLICVMGMTGCAGSYYTLGVHEEAGERLPASRVRYVNLPVSGQRVGIVPLPSLTERQVFTARAHSAPGGESVLIQFDFHGAALLSEITTRLQDRFIVVLVNDRPVGAVHIVAAINNGQLRFDCNLTEAQVRGLIASLNRTSHRRRDLGDRQVSP